MYVLFFISGFLWAQEAPKPFDPVQACIEQMKSIPGKINEAELAATCGNAHQLEGCQSTNGSPIFHFDRPGTSPNPKKIFAKSLIHGDEVTAGVMGRAWALRLSKIEPRNSWRLIVIANPDGWKKRTRTNSNGVDLNRNFPTKDWEADAIAY